MLRLLSALVGSVLLVSAASAQDVAESADALGTPRPSRASVLVVPAVGRGIDPVVAPHVTNALRAAAESLGYEVVSDELMQQAMTRLRLRDVASPADLWRATFVAQARRGVSTHVWAERGRYVFELSVASLDGTGPFRARGDASAEDLLERVAEELRRILAPAAEWNAEEAERVMQAATAQSAARAAPLPVREPPIGDLSAYRRRRGPTRTDRPFSVALQTEAAIGTTSSGFYNHLVGARLNYHFSRSFAAGIYLGYVNLRGNSGRVSNLLPYFQLEHRVHVIGEDGLSVPIRAAVGFLPYNGAFIRISGGLNLPIGDHFEIGADILTPTFWFTPDGRATSFDVALEVVYRFGVRGGASNAATPASSSTR
jgi:hypothetical protein